MLSSLVVGGLLRGSWRPPLALHTMTESKRIHTMVLFNHLLE
jgi:hypothetical protein